MKTMVRIGAVLMTFAFGSLLTAAPVKVVFDTDMYTDFDDAGALACLHALADAGECEILATVASTRGSMSVAMCEIVNTYYGRPDIPVGCVKGIGVGEDKSGTHRRIFGATVEKYARWVRHRNSDDAPDAVDVYRRVLSTQPDKSVVICSVGFLTNMRKLMETDRDLVARKVRLWVVMACYYPMGKECNSKTDAESSRIAFERWPTPIVFSDFQYGMDCFAGRALAESDAADSPVADVFRGRLPTREQIARDAGRHLRNFNGLGGRAAWDETAVLAAVRGVDSYFNVHRGTYRMVGTEGENEWVPDEANGPHLRLTEKTSKLEIGRILDELMCRRPLALRAEFISVPLDGSGRMPERTSAFLRTVVNAKTVEKAEWRTTAFGVYEAYVNGEPTDGFLKPGFTHVYKRRLETTADVTMLWTCTAGATNVLSALVTRGWWRDQITGRRGLGTGFRGVLTLCYSDGTAEDVLTDGSWLGGIGGPVVDATIFDGETYDARVSTDWMKNGVAPTNFAPVRICRDYVGDITPMGAKAVALREDLLLKPVRSWVWRGVEGANEDAFGKARVVREPSGGSSVSLSPGETLVVDFGQNAAAEPRFAARAARGVTVTVLPAEMLNDGDGLRSRGNDGPGGSVYRANLRSAKARAVYTFSGKGTESYMPRFSFFGYRYLSIVADGDVTFTSLASVPVSSVRAEQENGSIVTGVAALNRFVENVKWSHRSNYLSVPTDCPQRDERLGWTADTQVFAPTALYLADVARFLGAWMDDLADSQHANGAYPCVAPLGSTGSAGPRFGWSDAGIVVPWTVWKHTGDAGIVKSHWDSMMRFLCHIDQTQYRTEPGGCQFGDWLSFEPMETCRDGLWKCADPEVLSWWAFLGGCHWRQDALRMGEMARAVGRDADAIWCMASAERALSYLRSQMEDGRLPEVFRKMQTANLFALRLGVFAYPVRAGEAKATLLKNIAGRKHCLATGFLGTAFILDELVELGETETAYSLLLNHDFPSWLYEVDQGATTVWERWNSYAKKDGFGPVEMNSFNHYAYGAIVAWLYRCVAGIAVDSKNPGFKNIIMAPKPDRRLGHVKAEYKSAAGLIKSAWRYEGDDWIWEFTVPMGATADVTLPGENTPHHYMAGNYVIRK